jgi:hypothetical protein
MLTREHHVNLLDEVGSCPPEQVGRLGHVLSLLVVVERIVVTLRIRIHVPDLFIFDYSLASSLKHPTKIWFDKQIQEQIDCKL